MLQRLLGVNWKTTITGILAIVAVIAKILNDYRTKDFQAIFANLNNLIPMITGLLIGLGLLSAKDSDTKGAGPNATKVDDQGKAVTP